MKTRAQIALLFLSILLLPATVCAHPRATSGGYSVRVENEWGRELPTFYKQGQTYVLGSLGERYSVRVRNQSGTRVEAVVTVDGRDVVSGDEGDFVGERGYLIDAYGEVVIEGFRRNYDEVAAFRFSSPGDSYSSRMGTPQNVGIIGVALFPERIRRVPIAKPIARPRPVPYSYNYGRGGVGTGYGRSESKSRSAAPSSSATQAPARTQSGASAERSAGDELRRDSEGYAAGNSDSSSSYRPGAPAPAEADNLGTEYGESVGSAAREVTFVRADAKHPAAVLTVRYDDAHGLQARGIQLYPSRPIARATPDPFPRNRFAAPPP